MWLAMASDSRVFILGGKGLVGSGFARFCERENIPHVVLDRQNYSFYAGQRCSILINANGNSSKLLATREPMLDFDASVKSVRASLLDFQYDKYVYISSCDVYPDCSSTDTTMESQTPDPERQSRYGFHKYLAEQCVRHGAADWLILRCGGFLSPDLKKNAIHDILAGGPLFLDPASELQFLHTDQAAAVVFSVLQEGVSREVLNLCGRGVVRLEEAIQAAEHVVTLQPGSPLVRYEVSIAKISRLVEIPETRSSVLKFIRSRIDLRRSLEH